MKRLLIFCSIAALAGAQTLPTAFENFPTNQGALAFSSIISPTALASNTNNYAPTGLSTAGTLRISASTTVDLTGLSATGVPDGATKVIHNIGSSTITLKDESTSSTSTNRFALSGDIGLAADQTVVTQYDATTGRWRVLNPGTAAASVDQSAAYNWTGAHTFALAPVITLNDATNNAVVNILSLAHNTTGSPAAGLGNRLLFSAETSTTIGQEQGSIDSAWSDVANGTRTSYMDFRLVDSATAGSKMRLHASGGLSVNSTTDPGTGIINTSVGYKAGSTEFPVASNGLVKRNSANTYAAVTAPSGAVVGTTDAQTLTNKSVKKRVDDQLAPISPYVIDSDSYDMVVLRGINAALTLSAPTGTPTQGQPLIIRFKDNGTARALTFTTGTAGSFREGTDIAFPTTTVINKTIYCGFFYNTTDSRWDLAARVDNL